jgi:hypothetical protein
MLTPGAETLGLMMLPNLEGPREEKFAIKSSMSVAPLAKASGLSPGEPTELQEGPLFPAANAGKIPAARQLWI